MSLIDWIEERHAEDPSRVSVAVVLPADMAGPGWEWIGELCRLVAELLDGEKIHGSTVAVSSTSGFDDVSFTVGGRAVHIYLKGPNGHVL